MHCHANTFELDVAKTRSLRVKPLAFILYIMVMMFAMRIEQLLRCKISDPDPMGDCTTKTQKRNYALRLQERTRSATMCGWPAHARWFSTSRVTASASSVSRLRNFTATCSPVCVSTASCTMLCMPLQWGCHIRAFIDCGCKKGRDVVEAVHVWCG